MNSRSIFRCSWLVAAFVSFGLSSSASAEGLRIRAGASFRAGASVRVGAGSRRVVRRPPPRRAHLRIGGHWQFGIRIADPAPPVVVQVAPPPPPLERRLLALGVLFGAAEVGDGGAGGDLALLGRLGLSRHIALELEVAETEFAASGRVDRRAGGGLLYDFGPADPWSVYLVGGTGLGRLQRDESDSGSPFGYAELGAGLTWRVSDRFHLMAELRGGNQRSSARHMSGGRALYHGSPSASLGGDEGYSRARIGGFFAF